MAGAAEAIYTSASEARTSSRGAAISNPPFYSSRAELEDKAESHSWAMGELAEILREEGDYSGAATLYYKAADTADEQFVQIVGVLEERLGVRGQPRDARIAALANRYARLAEKSVTSGDSGSASGS